MSVFSSNIWLLYLDTCLFLTTLFFSHQALALALHKFKVSEEQRKYSIDSPEPLVAFALSCGMYSSPAVVYKCSVTLSPVLIADIHNSEAD